jgi:hypothetical protein
MYSRIPLVFLLGILFTFSFHEANCQGGALISREIGLRLNGLSDFDFIYKKKIGQDKFRRYRVGFTNFNFSSTGSIRVYGLAFGIGAGNEKRREIAEKLSFIIGFEILANANFTRQVVPSPHRNEFTISPGAGFVLGFQYDLSDKFYLNIETIPTVNANLTFRETPFENTYGVSGRFDSNAVALSLVYKFQSPPKHKK